MSAVFLYDIAKKFSYAKYYFFALTFSNKLFLKQHTLTFIDPCIDAIFVQNILYTAIDVVTHILIILTALDIF